MKKFHSILFTSLLLLLSLASLTHASTYYTLTLADIASFEEIGQDPSDADCHINNVAQFPSYVSISTTIQPFYLDPPSYAGIGIGKRFDKLDLSNFDTFMLSMVNVNENPWQYSLFVMDVDGNSYYTDPIELSPDRINKNFITFTMNLSDASNNGVDLENIVAIGFGVGALVPIDTDDVTNETLVAPVPEPGTILLLGAGLLGLGFFGRRRMKA